MIRAPGKNTGMDSAYDIATYALGAPQVSKRFKNSGIGLYLNPLTNARSALDRHVCLFVPVRWPVYPPPRAT
jgi:hypothetical protein